MSDLSLEDAGIPPTEDSIPDLSLLNIHSSVKETQGPVMDPLSSKNQVSLTDLHQDYIDKIAKFLDPKSLFYKGAAAQRLVEFTPRTIDYMGISLLFGKEPNKMKFYVDGSRHFSFLTETQFEATAFRLLAETLIINKAFTLEDCDYIDEHLRGRGTIRELQLGTPTVDAIRFNKFLQDFHISELTVFVMPVKYFTQPNVQKLEKLEYGGFFPISLNYLSDSSTHSGRITFDRRTFDYDDLNLLLQKWAANEKVIKELKSPLWSFMTLTTGFAFCVPTELPSTSPSCAETSTCPSVNTAISLLTMNTMTMISIPIPMDGPTERGTTPTATTTTVVILLEHADCLL